MHERWIIDGVLEVVTPLAIRTGHEEEPWSGKRADREPNHVPDLAGHNAGSVPVAEIELDASFRPFVPATALKGLVRSAAAAALDIACTDVVDALLGDSPRKGRTGQDEDAAVSIGGLVEFRNPYLPQEAAKEKADTWLSAIRGRTAIHEGTRTAEDGQLRHDRIVAPGTRFHVSIVLCGGNQDQVEALLGLLALIDGKTADSALGSGTSQGDGRVAWHVGKVRRFGSAEARKWMKSDKGTWDDFASQTSVEPMVMTRQRNERIVLPIVLEIAGHFLVGAREKVPGKKAKDGQEAKDVARLRPYRVDGHDDSTARLAGSSLDGALRSQALRIFRTMSGDHTPWPADDTGLPECLQSLFGSGSQGSLLECETFTAPNMSLVTQEFVAIDRFSGGAADEKKFEIRAFEAPRLSGTISVALRRSVEARLTGKANMTDRRSITPAAIGLLALTIKDLACGDIPLGHGTRKGYGGVANLRFGDKGWTALLESLGEQAVHHGILEGTDGGAAIQGAVLALEEEAQVWREAKGLYAEPTQEKSP